MSLLILSLIFTALNISFVNAIRVPPIINLNPGREYPDIKLDIFYGIFTYHAFEVRIKSRNERCI